MNFPNNLISDFVPQLGGVINAYTEFDTTCYYMMLPSEHISKGLQILSEIAFKANFSEQDLSIEKDIIIEEIKQYDNEPESSFIDWIQNTYFKINPLKEPILGTKQSILNASHSACQKFYHDFYKPDNCFLVISGCFDPETIHKQINEFFGIWDLPLSDTPEVYINPQPECNGFNILTRVKKSEDTFLAFTLPELIETDRLSDATLLLIKAFAADKHSRLYKRLVEKDKLALGIRLHSISGKYPGITVVQIIPSSINVIADIVYALYDELCKIKQQLLSMDEISLIKREMYYSWLFDFEYIESIGSSLASEEILSAYQELYKFPDRINHITMDVLAESLDKYWIPDFISIYYQGQKDINRTLKNNIKKLFGTQSITALADNESLMIIPQDEIIKTFDSKQNLQNAKPASSDKFKEVRLHNGMRLLMNKVYHKPTICASITAPMSQLLEDVSNRGINYFTSVLMLYGSQTKSYDELQKESLQQGYSIKINHTLETNSLKGKCFPFSFDNMLGTLADLLQNPLFPQKHLNIIKASTIDNIRREKNSPFSNSYSKWVDLFLGKNTNLNKSYGNISQTRQINLSGIHDWYDRNYSLPDFTVSITGAIDFPKIEDTCNQLFLNQAMPADKSIEKYQYQSSMHHVKNNHNQSDQSNIIIGGLGCPATDTVSNTAFYILSQILGGDLSSRFFNILREKHGYSYQTGFDFTSIKDFGFWFAYAICDKKDYKKVLAIIYHLLEDIRVNGVTQEELDSAKNYLLGLHRMDMESLSWQANSLSILYALGYDYDYFMSREKRIMAIDRDIIMHLAQQWFKPENMYTYFES